MFGSGAIELAQIQFAFTVSFHSIFPALTCVAAPSFVKGLRDERDAWSFFALTIFALNYPRDDSQRLIMILNHTKEFR